MTNSKRGELYAFLLSILESWFPIFTLIILQSIGAMSAYTLSIMVATIAFITIQKGWHEFKVKEAYKDLLLTTFSSSCHRITIHNSWKYVCYHHSSAIFFLSIF
jgi:hypothetical protein